jgi:hypothetical protein
MSINITAQFPTDTEVYATLYNNITAHPAYTIFYTNNTLIMDLLLIAGIIVMFIGLFSIILLPRVTYIILSLSSFILSVTLGIIFTSKAPSMLFLLFATYSMIKHLSEEYENKLKESVQVNV